MALPESQSKVLEDGTEALLEAETSVADDSVEEGEEFVDLSTPAPEAKPAVAAPVAKSAAKPAAKPAAPADEEIPEELRGKTPAQLAKMYREAQQVIGRQGSELGDYRKKVDGLILSSLDQIRQRKAEAAPKPAEAEAELDDSAIFADPKGSIAKLVERHPLIKEIREALGKSAADNQVQRAAAATERFNATHPDSAQIMQDPEFRSWVSASRVRSALLQRAHAHFDFDAGDEVFSTWKALRGTGAKKDPVAEATAAEDGAPDEATVKAAAQTMARARAAKTQKATQDAAAQAAAAPTGGASAGKTEGGKKIYRRADVIRLMEDDPDRYEALSDEIAQAYRENRVR